MCPQDELSGTVLGTVLSINLLSNFPEDLGHRRCGNPQVAGCGGQGYPEPDHERAGEFGANTRQRPTAAAVLELGRIHVVARAGLAEHGVDLPGRDGPPQRRGMLRLGFAEEVGHEVVAPQDARVTERGLLLSAEGPHGGPPAR